MTVVYNVTYGTFLTTHPFKSLNRVVSMTSGSTISRQMQTNWNSDKKHQKQKLRNYYLYKDDRNGAVQSVEN